MNIYSLKANSLKNIIQKNTPLKPPVQSSINKVKELPLWQIRDAFKKQYLEIIPQELEPVRKYKSDKYYRNINGLLRLGKKKVMSKMLWLRKCVDKKTAKERVRDEVVELEDIVRGIDRIMDRSIMPERVTVYRGISPRGKDRVMASADGVFVDNGFPSASYDKRQAGKFGSYIMKITVPKGAKAIDMQTALEKVPRWHDWEDELLLPRGSRFKIEGYDEATKTINMTLLSPESSLQKT